MKKVLMILITFFVILFIFFLIRGLEDRWICDKESGV